MFSSVSAAIPRQLFREMTLQVSHCNRFTRIAKRNISSFPSSLIQNVKLKSKIFPINVFRKNHKYLKLLAMGSVGTTFLYSQCVPELQVEQWSKLLKIDLPPKNGLAEAEWIAQCEELCFNKALQLCNAGNWKQLPLGENSLQDLKDRWGRTLFLACVESGNQKCVEYLISQKYGIRIKDRDGNNGLHIAAKWGHAFLIDTFIDVFGFNETNSKGFAPLHTAIESGHSHVVKALIRRGASSKLVDDQNDTPVTLAVKFGQKECLDVLFDEKEGKLLPSEVLTTHLLNLCIEYVKIEMLEHLLDKYSHATLPLLKGLDDQGRSPLHLAARMGFLDVIRLLEKKKIDINIVDSIGRNCVHWAVLGEQPEVLKFLSYLGADLQQPDGEGKTPMMLLDDKKSEKATLCRIRLNNYINIHIKELQAPPNYFRHPPENLVFEGEGFNEIAYIGVLKKMHELDALQELKRVAGISTGAIIACLIAVGYSPNDLEEIFIQKEAEPDRYKICMEESQQSGLKKIVGDYWQQKKSEQGLFQSGRELFRRLVTSQGLCDNSSMREWIENCIYEKTGIHHCTFGELSDRATKKKECKELQVYAMNVHQFDLSKVECLNAEQYDDLILSDAVMAAANTPGLFKPHVLHFKDKQGRRHARADLGAFVDASLLKALPIEAYDSAQYQVSERWGSRTNPKTLGLHLCSDPDRSKREKIEGSDLNLIQRILFTFWDSQSNLHRSQSNDRDRVMKVNIVHPFIKFVSKKEEQLNLIKEGEKSANIFFEGLKAGYYDFVDPARARWLRIDKTVNDFIQREENQKLESHLGWNYLKHRRPRDLVKVFLLWGQGGMGKTECALEFANKHRNDFSRILTFHYGNQAQLYDEYLEIAKSIHPDVNLDNVSLETLKTKVHKYLENDWEKPWLLFFDNVEHDLKSSDYPQRGGCVLITSQRNNILTSDRLSEDHKIKIEPFPRKEAIELFTKVANRRLSEDITVLVEELGRFPFAIYQVASYFREVPDLTVEQYRKNNPELFEAEISPQSYKKVLENVWKPALEYLADIKKTTNSVAVSKWLSHCSYLSPDRISRETLEMWAKHHFPNENACNVANNIIRALLRFDLMKVSVSDSKSFFSVHRLFQDSIRRNQKESASEVYGQVLEFFKKNISGDEFRLALDNLPHMESLVENKFFSHIVPSSQLDLLRKVSFSLEVVGNYRSALFYANLGYKIFLSLPPSSEERKSVADSAYILALAEIKLGEYQNALKHAREGWEANGKLKGINEEIYLTIMGDICFKQADYKNAFKYYEKSWKKYGQDRLVHTCLLEELQRKLGRPAVSSKMITTCWDIVKEKFGGIEIDEAIKITAVQFLVDAGVEIPKEGLNHFDLIEILYSFVESKLVEGQLDSQVSLKCAASRLNSLGMVIHRFQGDLSEALKRYEQALQIYRQLVEEKDDPTLSIFLINTADCHLDLGQLEKATMLYRQSLEMDLRLYKKGTDRNPLHLATNYYHRGMVSARFGENADALSAFISCKEILLRVYDENHYLMADTLDGIAGILLKNPEQLSHSLQYLQRSLNIRRKIYLNEDNIYLFRSYSNMSIVLEKMDRLGEALKKNEQGLEIAHTIFSKQPHVDLGMLLNTRGKILEKMHLYREALENYEQSHSIFQKIGSSHPMIAGLKLQESLSRCKEKSMIAESG